MKESPYQGWGNLWYGDSFVKNAKKLSISSSGGFICGCQTLFRKYFHSIPSGCTDQGMVYSSGRIPTDMTLKVIHAGIPILSSKASPTSEAIDLAKKYHLTLICAGKQNVIFLSENAAMCGKGNAMERRTIRKGIRHMKDPFWFPENRCKWLRLFGCNKVII